jgi:hypothetical protein
MAPARRPAASALSQADKPLAAHRGEAFMYQHCGTFVDADANRCRAFAAPSDMAEGTGRGAHVPGHLDVRPRPMAIWGPR